MLDNITLFGIASIAFSIISLAFARLRVSHAQRLMTKAKDQWKITKHDLDTERRESSLKLKDEMYKRRKEAELELKQEKMESTRIREKIQVRKVELANQEQQLENLGHDLQQKERDLSRSQDVYRTNEAKLKTVYSKLIAKLEGISGMSRDEAKKTLLSTLEAEVVLTHEKWIQKVEDDTRAVAKTKAMDIVVSCMQRYTADQVASHTSGVVQLPNEEMKGRIIGKEGRNIKALEMATGMEFVIGDMPEAITISGFNPIRREVARRALIQLVNDGRINPTRIEETVQQCEKEIEDAIEEYGKETVLQFNLQGLHPELITMLGKLHFRTSFTQNVLTHSKEVGVFAQMIALELGLDGQKALRAGLLHDIGKAVSAEIEGPHALVGAEIAKRCGEEADVVNAIAAHHEEVSFTSIYAPIVVIADTISACRPGARRETFSAYVKRLDKLEDIAVSFAGVKKAYALQAGREIRIMVQEDSVDDTQAAALARDIARKIEEEMAFPGQIKVNVIREKRTIEYAR